MKPSKQLEAAWALIQQPGKWTKGDWAQDSTGKPCNTDSKEATCWCSVGALRKVKLDAQIKGYEAVTYLSTAAMELTLGAKVAVELNDEASTVQELAPMWELAIKLAKGSEA